MMYCYFAAAHGVQYRCPITVLLRCVKLLADVMLQPISTLSNPCAVPLVDMAASCSTSKTAVVLCGSRRGATHMRLMANQPCATLCAYQLAAPRQPQLVEQPCLSTRVR
jgi:hypothetical protein